MKNSVLEGLGDRKLEEQPRKITTLQGLFQCACRKVRDWRNEEHARRLAVHAL